LEQIEGKLEQLQSQITEFQKYIQKNSANSNELDLSLYRYHRQVIFFGKKLKDWAEQREKISNHFYQSVILTLLAALVFVSKRLVHIYLFIFHELINNLLLFLRDTCVQDKYSCK
jgi:hypothetical protein